MDMKILLFNLLLLVVVDLGSSARILAVLPIISKSHNIFHNAIFRLLAKRGHQVVMYSPFSPPSPVANITHIPVKSSLLEEVDNWSFQELEEFTKIQNFYGFGFGTFYEMSRTMCTETFTDENIKKLLVSQEKFDLVFVEATLAQESLVVFGHRFKAPVINLQGFGTWTIVNWVVGNSLSISHIPDSTSFDFSNKMTFVERARNFISTVVYLIFYHFDYLPFNQKILDQYYPGPAPPPLQDMLRDISLTFSNDIATLEYPRPYTPNLIPVGGVHLSSHKTPLPQDIKKFMDEGTEGVIFFSLGSLVPAHVLPPRFINAFVNTFKRLNKRILWKINLDSLPGLPDNVKLTKWAPQPTVLAHPNCQLFITHGGLFSQHEVLHAGKPVVAIPFFADQRYNVRFYEELGVGIKLELTSISENTFHQAITRVLDDPRFKERSAEVSRLAKDHAVQPADAVVFWTEYVLRHKGAQHLRPVTVGLPFYQRYLLDVLAIIIAVVLLVIFVLNLLIRKTLSIFLSRKQNVSSDKKLK